jgi:hypothetical protein
MINSKELRIGNKVLFGVIIVEIRGIHTQRIVRESSGIDAIKEHYYVSGFIEKSDYYAANSSDIDPLPLTPEVLEKCGFSKTFSIPEDQLGCDEWTDANKKCMIHFDTEDWWFGYWNIPKQHNDICIQSLHQLQNLYYSLTAEELQYKP